MQTTLEFALQAAKKYLTQHVHDERTECAIVQVKHGEEPPMFRCNFHAWDISKANKLFLDPLVQRSKVKPRKKSGSFYDIFFSDMNARRTLWEDEDEEDEDDNTQTHHALQWIQIDTTNSTKNLSVLKEGVHVDKSSEDETNNVGIDTDNEIPAPGSQDFAFSDVKVIDLENSSDSQVPSEELNTLQEYIRTDLSHQVMVEEPVIIVNSDQSRVDHAVVEKQGKETPLSAVEGNISIHQEIREDHSCDDKTFMEEEEDDDDKTILPSDSDDDDVEEGTFHALRELSKLSPKVATSGRRSPFSALFKKTSRSTELLPIGEPKDGSFRHVASGSTLFNQPHAMQSNSTTVITQLPPQQRPVLLSGAVTTRTVEAIQKDIAQLTIQHEALKEKIDNHKDLMQKANQLLKKQKANIFQKLSKKFNTISNLYIQKNGVTLKEGWLFHGLLYY